jgi:hypothetical protein
MGLIEAVLRRFGYVKLKSYGMTLYMGQIVPLDPEPGTPLALALAAPGTSPGAPVAAPPAAATADNAAPVAAPPPAASAGSPAAGAVAPAAPAGEPAPPLHTPPASSNDQLSTGATGASTAAPARGEEDEEEWEWRLAMARAQAHAAADGSQASAPVHEVPRSLLAPQELPAGLGRSAAPARESAPPAPVARRAPSRLPSERAEPAPRRRAPEGAPPRVRQSMPPPIPRAALTQRRNPASLPPPIPAATRPAAAVLPPAATSTGLTPADRVKLRRVIGGVTPRPRRATSVPPASQAPAGEPPAAAKEPAPGEE